MTTESAVDFPTPTRVHVALAVRDVSQATSFYRALFDQEPTKERPGYAKFEVLDPPLNLALNETPDAFAPPDPQHYGIQVKRRAAIGEISSRLAEHGFRGEVEDEVTCCYAVQDKVWVSDPDGHRWELFLVTNANADVHSKPGRSAAADPHSCVPAAQAEPAAEPIAEPVAAPVADEAAETKVERPCCAPTCCQ